MNITVLLPTREFKQIVQFASTKSEIMSQFVIEYTFDCSRLESTLIIGKLVRFAYGAALLILMAKPNGIMHRWFREERNELTDLAEIITAALQKMFAVLLLLCYVHRYAANSFNENCPWTIEKDKESVSYDATRSFVGGIIESYVFCLGILVAIGFGVKRHDLSMTHINIAFFLTIVKFLMVQFFAAIFAYLNWVPLILVLDMLFAFINFMLITYFVIINWRHLTELVALLHMHGPSVRRITNQVLYRRNLYLSIASLLLLHSLMDFLLFAGIAVVYMYEGDGFQEMSIECQLIRQIKQAVVLIGISLIQSGLFDRCLNRSGDRNATSALALDYDFLNDEYVNRGDFELELYEIRIRMPIPMKYFIRYQVDFTKELAAPSEADFVRLEPIQDQVSSSQQDVVDMPERFFVILGPEVEEPYSLTNLDLKVAKLEELPAPNKQVKAVSMIRRMVPASLLPSQNAGQDTRQVQQDRELIPLANPSASESFSDSDPDSNEIQIVVHA